MVERFQITPEVRSWVPVLTAVAFFGALWRLPYWFYPTDMKRGDGSADPRAGRFAPWKMVTELVVLPLLIFGGALAIGLGFKVAWVLGAVAILAVLNTAFFYETVTRLRDGGLGIFLEWAKRMLLGGK